MTRLLPLLSGIVQAPQIISINVNPQNEQQIPNNPIASLKFGKNLIAKAPDARVIDSVIPIDCVLISVGNSSAINICITGKTPIALTKNNTNNIMEGIHVKMFQQVNSG